MKIALPLWMAGLLTSLQLNAADITVHSLPELQTAISKAAPGDVIWVANGVYKTDADIVINKQGTAAKPITIAAQTLNGAEITGNGGFSLISPATHIIIRGFRFSHPANKAKCAPGTSFCRWTRNVLGRPGTEKTFTSPAAIMRWITTLFSIRMPWDASWPYAAPAAR